ncbi:type II secretion system protein, partial [bacterium]|nr:type II secretion system protein [bacterium]
ICNTFKGELFRVNSEQNDINANNCRTVNSRQFTHNSSLSTVHSLAFTLAETLIVMGIIGVVAALTIPNMNKNTNNTENVVKLKKFYTEIQNAHELAITTYGPIDTWFVNDTNNVNRAKRYLDRITEFLKTTKLCRDSANNCMTSGSSKFLKGGNLASYPNPSAILNDGISIYLGWFKYPNCNGNEEGYSTECGYIVVDIDGPKKGKFTWGIDLFQFSITKKGIEPDGGSSEFWTDDQLKKECFFMVQDVLLG